MNAKKIVDGIDWVGAVDRDRRLFDSLIPLPEGTSYNAYLVRGSDKTALVDTVDPCMAGVLMDHLAGVERVDVIVAQHAEQDHSGCIPMVLDRYPDATVITSPRGKGMLTGLIPVPDDKIVTVEDGARLSLGDKTLHFIHTPWAHWPETMSTYVPEDRVLLSCDLYGSHLAGDELFAVDEERVFHAAKRYYAEIMMPLRAMIQKNMPKLDRLDVATIAPSHGPVYGRPALIVDAYRHWLPGECRNAVALPYVSMHGSVEQMIAYLAAALAGRGVDAEAFNLAACDIGDLAAFLVDAATIVLGTPMVLAGPHPTAMSGAYLISTLKPPVQFASAVVSFGWGGKAAERLSDAIADLKAEMIPPVQCKGSPKEADFRALDGLADTIVDKHRARGLA